MKRLAPLVPILFALLFTMSGSARADKAPPPVRKLTLGQVETGPCERDGKAIDCPKAATDAAEAMRGEVLLALRKAPIRCGFGARQELALHMYWGDGFGSVVDIDFDPERAPPDCASRLVQLVADGLTKAFKAAGDADELLRVHWTVGFAIAY